MDKELNDKIKYGFKCFLALHNYSTLGSFTDYYKENDSNYKFIITCRSSIDDIEELFLTYCEKYNYDKYIDLITLNISETIHKELYYQYHFNYDIYDWIKSGQDMDLL